MAEISRISWTNATFNPWLGCTKVSPGCANCYAEAWAKRSGLVEWGKGNTRRLTSDANWRKPLKWDREAAKSGTRKRVFCASLADVFDDEAPDEWRRRLWDLIEATPYLEWMLLTKRIENAARMLPEEIALNVWIGVTTVNQREVDEKVPILVTLPARLRFLSLEPLLGPIEFSDVTNRADAAQKLGKAALDGIDWVIVGGESGPGYRPMNHAWARSIRDQCRAASVAFFFKQSAGARPGSGEELDGEIVQEVPVL